MKSGHNSTRLRVGRGSSTPKITTIGAALDTRTAIIRAGRSGDFHGQAVRELLDAIDHGQRLSNAGELAAQFALTQSVNRGLLHPMAAHRAARTLGGWR
jgi:hypothetical protein